MRHGNPQGGGKNKEVMGDKIYLFQEKMRALNVMMFMSKML